MWWTGEHRRPGWSAGAVAGALAVSGLLVAMILSLLLSALSRREGDHEATRSFESLAAVVAGSVVAPAITPALLSGDPAAQEPLRSVTTPLLAVGPVVHIAVDEPDGHVAWADRTQLIGTVAPLTAAQDGALRLGSVTSDRERRAPGLLTTSVGVRDASGSPVLVELVRGPGSATPESTGDWTHFAPASLGALALLGLVQVPVAWVLARRLRRHEEAEEELRETADGAAGVERRRIAAEVHDHVIPELTGVACHLDACRLGSPDAGDPVDVLDRTAREVRGCIGELRRLLVDLSRTRVSDAGLVPALTDLADRMSLSGVRVELRTSGLEDVPAPAAELVYRCAQETLRNVSAHSRATQVELSAVREGDEVTVTIDDDGCGFDQRQLAERSTAGHLGLHALGGLVADAGGSLRAASAPGQGTRVSATVPVPVSR